MTLRVSRVIVEVLGELPVVPPSINLDAESALSLTQSATINAQLAKSATSTLSLSDSASFNKSVAVSATSELIRTELIEDPETGELVPTEVGLTDEVSFTARLSKTASNILALGQDVLGVNIQSDAIALSADNALSLSQVAQLSETPDSGSVMTLSDSASATVSKPLTNALELSDSATVVGIWNRSAESELVLGQSVGLVFIPAAGRKLCEADITLQGPYPGITSRFALIYPATGSATDTVEIRPPDLGNKDRLSFQRINRETRGGTLVIFADPNWPKIQTLVLSFSALKRTEAQELLRFMKEHVGQEIKLSDWEQRVWRGIITTPNDPIIQDGKDSFSASFQFEGELTTP